MKSYYVYTLARPDGSIFYVGKGKGYRIRQHEQEALRGHDCPKCRVIRSIWQQGGTVQRAIVFETDDAQIAYDHEIALIREIGREHLTNRTNGGDGGKRTAKLEPIGQSVHEPVQDLPTIADLVNRLFGLRRHSSGREYSNSEVTLGMRGKHDRSYVRKVRTGEIPNPGYQALLELCIFFRVPITYFFPQLDAFEFEPLPPED